MTHHGTDSPLTERQREIAALIADDLTNSEIAECLDISLATTKHHVSGILARLELPRREAAGDWYQARYRPGILRRLRGVASAPIVLAAGAGLAVVAAVVVLALVLFARSDTESPAIVLIGGGDTPAPSHIVAYTLQPGLNVNEAELWIHDLETGVDTQLLALDDGFENIRDVRWDAPSETFVFSVTAPGDRGVYRIDLDGNVEAIEVPGRDPLLFARWSSDGRRLAVVTTGEPGTTAVTVVEPDGSVRVLADDTLFHAWSPDGETLYYQRLQEADGHIWRFGPDGDARFALPTEGLGEHQLRGVTSDSGVLLFEVDETESGCTHTIAIAPNGDLAWVAPGQSSSASPRGDRVAIGNWHPVIEPCAADPLLDAGPVVAHPDWPPSSVVVLDASGTVITRFDYPAGSRPGGGVDARFGFGRVLGPQWDESGSQLLLQGVAEDGDEIVWLGDLESGELTELHRVPPSSAPGQAWLGVAFGP